VHTCRATEQGKGLGHTTDHHNAHIGLSAATTRIPAVVHSCFTTAGGLPQSTISVHFNTAMAFKLQAGAAPLWVYCTRVQPATILRRPEQSHCRTTLLGLSLTTRPLLPAECYRILL
jgi:hypothetical protein